jgi:AraC-like DNA-binding protein
MPKSFVAGQFCQSYYLEPTGVTGVIGIKFKPNGLFDLFQIPMTLFTNKIIDFATIAGEEAHIITEQIIANPPNNRRIEIIEEYLMKKLMNRKSQLDYMQRTVSMIMESIGNITVKELASKLNISDRQIERKFKEQIGISPKMFSRLTRINYVFKLLRTNPELNWQDVIFLCGYYDQAHFIRDFKEISGESPNVFLSRKAGISTEVHQETVLN